MGESLLATCLVQVDDVMPDGELSDLEGNVLSISTLYGLKLTVIFFWTVGDGMFAREAAAENLQDLREHIAEPYLAKGVQVIGINENNPPDVVAELAAQTQSAFPMLRDPEGAFFAKVATETMPRVYLLDADGKILWLDTELSRTSREGLTQAIQVVLGEIGGE